MSKIKEDYITERAGKKGFSYLVRLRQNGFKINKTFKDRNIAEKFVIDTLSRINRGENLDVIKMRKITLGEIFQIYIESGNVSKNKIYSLKCLIKEIGLTELGEFKAGTFETFLKHKLNQEIPDQKGKENTHKLYKNYMIVKNGKKVRRTYSASSIRKVYYDIKTALAHHAKHFNYPMDMTPFDQNKPPKAWSNVNDRILEDGELDNLIKNCDKFYKYKEEFKALIRFQYLSAMRCGESLLMKWEHIKLYEGDKAYNSYIFVPKENQKIADKDGSKDRYIPLFPEFYYFIKDELLPLKKENQTYIFGEYWNTSNKVGQKFKVLCKNSKIDNLVIHSFRHTRCTIFFRDTNLSQIEISEISGHIELSTLKRYLNLRSGDVGKKLWLNYEMKKE